MKILSIALVVAALGAPLVAQEGKPVPKDSMRVFIPGCTKGRVFTAGPRTVDQPGRTEVPPGMHLTMSGPKAMLKKIADHKESMVEITGLIKKGELDQPG